MLLQRYFFFIWLYILGQYFFSTASARQDIYHQPTWGFYAHKQINRLAVFTLPAEMMPFFKKHIDYLTENAVNPDKRRYAVVGEAPRHFIDLDVYPDTSVVGLPRFYKTAVEQFGEDTLALHGIVPWHIQLAKFQLTEAFRQNDAQRILKIAADLGHYIADANVPLHTTRNYNGQFTGQGGIHGFWESRLPELFSLNYDFLTGQAEYLYSPQKAAWRAVFQAHAALDSVLRFEQELTVEIGETRKFSFEERNGVTTKVYSEEFSRRYHDLLRGQVERQMRAAVKMIGDFWYTCWVDAGQPDLRKLAKQQLTEQQKQEDDQEKQSWLKRLLNIRSEGE